MDDKRQNAGRGRKVPVSLSVSPSESHRGPDPTAAGGHDAPATPAESYTGGKAGVAAACGLLKCFPLKTFLVVLVLCGVVKDNFPFSHFPMYDHFPEHTFYVFVKDGRGGPIALESVTGMRTANFKKPYDKELNRIRKSLDKRKLELSVAEREPAGRRALENLYQRAPEPVKRRLESLAPLQFYHADILMEAGVILQPEPERIAILPLPPK